MRFKLGLLLVLSALQFAAHAEESIVLTNESSVETPVEAPVSNAQPLEVPLEEAVVAEPTVEPAEVVQQAKKDLGAIPSTNPDDAANAHGAWRKRKADLAKKDLPALRQAMFEEAMKNARNSKRK